MRDVTSDQFSTARTAGAGGARAATPAAASMSRVAGGMRVTHHTVGDRAGQRLDNFLLARLKGVPRRRIYAMVRKGEVRVNGGRAKPCTRLGVGDVVRVPPHRPNAPNAEAPHGLAAALEARILFEDARLIVLDKPAGIAAHGGSGIVAGVIEALRSVRPNAGLELVHRLDRDTSGCLAIAKDRATLLAAHAAFRSGRVKKTYDLIVAGRWPRRLRAAQMALQRYALPNGERRVRVSAAGLPARTDFEVRKLAPRATWLRAFPRTGRTHQIRVHASASGHAVLGDRKYARRDDAAAKASRLMLHASSIAFELDGARRRFEAPLDAAFKAAWERCAAPGEQAPAEPPAAAARRAQCRKLQSPASAQPFERPARAAR